MRSRQSAPASDLRLPVVRIIDGNEFQSRGQNRVRMAERLPEHEVEAVRVWPVTPNLCDPVARKVLGEEPGAHKLIGRRPSGDDGHDVAPDGLAKPADRAIWHFGR